MTGIPIAAGCSATSTSQPVATHPVRGQVLVSGRPAAGATVRFYSKSPGAIPVAPQGVTDKDGFYTLSSYGQNDGAPEGEYCVSITWRVDEKGAAVSEDAESGLPDRLGGRYANAFSSNLSAHVVAGDNTIAPLHLR